MLTYADVREALLIIAVYEGIKVMHLRPLGTLLNAFTGPEESEPHLRTRMLRH
jgi:hypothetical protein